MELNLIRNPIQNAVEPRRAAAVQRAKESAAANIEQMMDKLAQNDWNLNAVAPRAHGSMNRRDYKMAQALRNRFENVTTLRTKDAMDRSGLHMNLPRTVCRDEARIAKFIEIAGEDASLSFDSYIIKLTEKVATDETSPVNYARLEGGALWSYSYLVVGRADGTTETWKTQCIINVSVLGTLFNQWPTRRVK